MIDTSSLTTRFMNRSARWLLKVAPLESKSTLQRSFTAINPLQIPARHYRGAPLQFHSSSGVLNWYDKGSRSHGQLVIGLLYREKIETAIASLQIDATRNSLAPPVLLRIRQNLSELKALDHPSLDRAEGLYLLEGSSVMMHLSY